MDLLDLFPHAAHYPKARRTLTGYAKENKAPYLPLELQERHLQCLWYDTRWRPTNLISNAGQTIHIEHPGQWNLEAGPDFLGGIFSIDGQKRTGDIEIHTHPAGWKQHGHQNDPRYQNVRLHVTYYPGMVDPALLPKDTIQCSLKQNLDIQPGFDFERIDLAAYPYDIEAPLTPMRRLIKNWDFEKKQQLLQQAGHERLRRKAHRLQQNILQTSPDQAFYEEFMSAMGYKHNKAAFRRLATLTPLNDLLTLSDADPKTTAAIFLGLSGLLPADWSKSMKPQDAETLRPTWDHWWKVQSHWDGKALPSTLWQLHHLRPTNHPIRRMHAAATWIHAHPQPQQWCQPQQKETATQWIKRILKELQTTTPNDPTALIGKSRATAILLNVCIPFLAATNQTRLFHEGLLDNLPREASNQIQRQTAHSLFGPDHPETLYPNGICRQGLLQIFQDYGLSKEPSNPT